MRYQHPATRLGLSLSKPQSWSVDDILWLGVATILFTAGAALAVATLLPAPWPQIVGVSSGVALVLFARNLTRIIRSASVHISHHRLRRASRRRPALTDRIPYEHR